MHFTKMHGLGNDYLYYYGELEHPEELAVKLSDRHFGIGSDGIITISPSQTADFKMKIFNADGSEAKMCGNGFLRLYSDSRSASSLSSRTRMHRAPIIEGSEKNGKTPLGHRAGTAFVA